MEEIKLKPCPFCEGDRASMDYIIHGGRPYYKHYARVMCPFCQANVGSTSFSDTKEEAEEKAIKAWNRRAYETY